MPTWSSLSQDLLTIDPDDILATQVDLTVLGGTRGLRAGRGGAWSLAELFSTLLDGQLPQERLDDPAVAPVVDELDSPGATGHAQTCATVRGGGRARPTDDGPTSR